MAVTSTEVDKPAAVVKETPGSSSDEKMMELPAEPDWRSQILNLKKSLRLQAKSETIDMNNLF